MKNGKKPTVKQMKQIKASGLNPENWLVTKNLHDELHIVHRISGNEKVIFF